MIIEKIDKLVENLKVWKWPLIGGIVLLVFWNKILEVISKNAIKIYQDNIIPIRHGDSSYTGQIGDTMGGTTAPFIALFACILTFIAFWAQVLANRQVQNQFKIQQFESQFYEMIRLHRANVEEQNIQDLIRGRKVFTTYYFELRYIYVLLEKKNDSATKKQVDRETLTNLAYLIFFFGIGHASKNIFEDMLPNYCNEPFFQDTLVDLQSTKDKYSSGEKNPDLEITNKNSKAIFKQVYEPFTGHGTKIGHYYRHLYQTVEYVDSQSEKMFSNKQKYTYIKILRAQLSNIEQVLFYYNSISVLGKPWVDKGYIVSYKFIVNLPLSFADFGIKPSEKFKDVLEGIPDFFDWSNYSKFQN